MVNKHICSEKILRKSKICIISSFEAAFENGIRAMRNRETFSRAFTHSKSVADRRPHDRNVAMKYIECNKLIWK